MAVHRIAKRLNAPLLGREALAGVPGAIGTVPDGMASAVLAGVNPIHGLYASFAGPTAGGSVASTRLMVITTTTAASLTAGSAVAHVAPADRASALALLTLIAGLLMVGAGIARLGRYTRFVSLSVMTGFLTGVAVNIVLGQLAGLTGATATGRFALAKAVNLLTHPAASSPRRCSSALSRWHSSGWSAGHASPRSPRSSAEQVHDEGVLIVAAVSSVRVDRIVMIWRTGAISKVAFESTFRAGAAPRAHSRRFGLDGPIQVFEADPVVGASTLAALEEAEAWLVSRPEDPEAR